MSDPVVQLGEAMRALLGPRIARALAGVLGYAPDDSTPQAVANDPDEARRAAAKERQRRRRAKLRSGVGGLVDACGTSVPVTPSVTNSVTGGVTERDMSRGESVTGRDSERDKSVTERDTKRDSASGKTPNEIPKTHRNQAQNMSFVLDSVQNQVKTGLLSLSQTREERDTPSVTASVTRRDDENSAVSSDYDRDKAVRAIIAAFPDSPAKPPYGPVKALIQTLTYDPDKGLPNEQAAAQWLLSRVQAYAESPIVLNRQPQFRMTGATWLRERWYEEGQDWSCPAPQQGDGKVDNFAKAFGAGGAQ